MRKLQPKNIGYEAEKTDKYKIKGFVLKFHRLFDPQYQSELHAFLPILPY